MVKTKIEWADESWNPVVGCTPVSAGCAHCYARTMYNRFFQDKPFSKIQLHPEKLEDPLHWKKPRRVFVNSMSDLFHPDVPFEFIDQVGKIISQCRVGHVFLILTKRPERMLEYFKDRGNFTSNVWLGVTAESQQTANERIPLLLQTPATVRFVSVEPMLEWVDLSKWLDICPVCSEHPDTGNAHWRWNGYHWEHYHGYPIGHIECVSKPFIDLVIAGCESGTGRRTIELPQVRYLKNQCVKGDVKFFLKQLVIDGKLEKMPKLDGRVWDQFPEVGK